MPARAFSSTVARYLTSVLPCVSRELGHWRARALAIPDPVLRSLAVDALSKRGNMEGAALFAILAPRGNRREAARALVAFQTAYNYLDTLVEQPSLDPVGNGRELHQALLDALAPSAPQSDRHPDYYAHHSEREDGGFLAALVDTCREALSTLPSYPAVAAAAADAATRIVAFQSLNLSEQQGGQEALARWAREQTPRSCELDWWQTAGAGGSSLAVHALIAAAAGRELAPAAPAQIEAAYFPWICALHSLLDSLVDVAEDERAGQRNLLSYHASAARAANAMGILAERAIAAARELPDGTRHEVFVTAMAAYYLSSPEVSTPYASTIASHVALAFGPLLRTALILFKVRRLAARIAHGGYR